MKNRHRLLSMLCAGSMLLGSVSDLMMIPVHAAESDPDQLIRLQTGRLSPFNDTDGDGLPEFEGWGTSLCWWANRVGANEALTQDAVDKFFSDDGLDLNIGRYNLGGGDNVIDSLEKNPATVIYGLDAESNGPSYSGSKMSVSTKNYANDTKWKITDADLGILKGAKVGSLKEIGWIGPMDGTVGNGDTLKYTVHADKAGSYTIKLLFKLVGVNDGRSACIRVNGDADSFKEITSAQAQQNIAATEGNITLYLGTFENVALNEGDNTIEIGGSPTASNTWMYDFHYMAAVPSDQSKDGDPVELAHADHIVRSDSAVPGYCVDVTPITIDDEHPLSWYAENFDVADESCGFAWNYCWNKDMENDQAQLNVLNAAKTASGEDFIAEIFSNSPPWFMTESLCSSGNYNAGDDNLRPDSYDAFVTYIADVIEHLHNNGITFQSATAFNEPNTSYWGAFSDKQEGCHFDIATISTIIEKLDAKLKEKNIDLILSASDETSLDTQITVFNGLTDAAKEAVERIDVHTYTGSNRAGVRKTALDNNKNLWMSEVDGGFTAGENASEMSAPLGLAKRIIEDVSGLDCSAWIFWNLIDKHADNSPEAQKWIDLGKGIDKATIEDLNWNGQTGGYWGIAAADHNNDQLVLSMKYYGFGQFTRYIRPGYALMGSTGNTLAAYDPEGKKAVIVAVNEKADDSLAQFDLSGFTNAPTKVTAIRTSGTMEDGEKWADVSESDSITIDTNTPGFTASLKGNSITTYIVEGVGELKKADDRPLEMIRVPDANISSSTPYNNSATDTAYTLQDENFGTFFDGVQNGYVTYDLGKETEIAAIAYAPRNGYMYRCPGAVISGSHDGENWVTLHTISTTPAQGQDVYIYADGFDTTEHTFRYVRYKQDTNDGNISEFRVYQLQSRTTWNLSADYDMNITGEALKDTSGKSKDAPLTSLTSSASATYEDSSVVRFDGKGYAKLPAGLIDDGNSFTISMLAWAPQSSNHWLLTLGTKEDVWPNVKNYFFLTPSSAQSGYTDKVLAAIKDTDEIRLPVPAQASAKDAFIEYTVVSDGETLTVYANGEEITKTTHSKDWNAILGDEFTGFIGKSLYKPDPVFEGSLASFRVWNTALNEDERAQVATGEDEREAALKAALAGFILNANKNAKAIESDLTFPSSIYGQNVTWTISENAPVDEKGKLTVPLENTDFTVTAKFTGTNKEVTLNLTAAGEDADKIVADAKAELDIPNKDAIKGNISLPSSIGKAAITWEMSESGNGILDLNEKASSVEGYDPIPAGVITRPEEDTEITLTATISFKGVTETKTFELTVKAAPEQKTYTDYFFAYFTGEGKANGEQVYFSTSQDGLNWTDLNGGNPSLTSNLGEQGVRDPYILRSAEGDRFFIIATDLKINGGNGWDVAQTKGSQSLLVWESDDLIHWSEPRLVPVSVSIEAGCTWAPEATYDELTGEYVVYWSSKVKDDNYAKQRVYYVKTRDFHTFSEPKVWIEKDQSSIDTTVIKNGNAYYRLTKNEGGETNQHGAKTKTLFLEKADTLLGSYSHIESESLNANQWVEGPAIYKLNADDSESDKWILLADDFGGVGYYPLEATDLDSGQFTRLSDGFRMPSGARHGTPIAITADEYDAIMKAGKQIESISTWFTDSQTSGLPETVSMGHSTYPVTWSEDDPWTGHKAFDTVSITGTATLGEGEEAEQADVTASVQLIPQNLEYMIDCNNPNSQTHKNALAASSLLLNKTSEQVKTDDNTWGSVSSIGAETSNVDLVAFSQTSLTNPYTGGYWAKSGKNIDYAMTLPKGDHNILIGVNGWWNTSRGMELYVTTSKGTSKLMDTNITKSVETCHSGQIHLDKEETIILSLRHPSNDSQDPIIAWIGASRIDSASKEDLEKAIEEAGKLIETDYTPASWKALQDAVNAGQTVLDTPNASAAAITKAAADITSAIDSLVRQYQVTFKLNNEVVKTGYVADGQTAEAIAPSAADLTLPEGYALEGWTPAFTELHDSAEYVAILKVVVNFTALENKVAEIDAENLVEDNYSKTSWATFKEAYDTAKALLDGGSATQQPVDDTLKALSDARDALTRVWTITFSSRGSVVSTIKVENGVTPTAPENVEPPKGYRFIGWKPEITAASKNQTYIAQFEKVTVNKTPLTNEVKEVNNLTQKPEDDLHCYSADSWAAFTEARKTAKKVLLSISASQADVDKALKDLEDARNALELLDLSQLNEAVSKAGGKADSLDLSLFSDTGKEDLQNALANAKAMMKDPTNQKEINENAKDLGEALLRVRLTPNAARLKDLN